MPPLLPTGPPTRLKAIGKIIVKLVSDLFIARFSVHLQINTYTHTDTEDHMPLYIVN